ncbi:MAG TPA: exodeoxyribonuclease VII large subunit, partial [Candidatus Omnitrophota bacterium]|nr:exodeoxyribonuclease VII large subunit [Candidatus Omnitrophota bacterium]
AEVQGKGALQVAFEQLKLKLYKEGLFDERHKRPIPLLPVRIGVVTSPTGAAVRDIIKVACKRFSNVEITICPVKVQGPGAKEDIAMAILALNEYNEYLEENGSLEHKIDVMIVGRGGGSVEDLWAFNEEVVARAIFDSTIPVISAVGHEIDFTISDFVADVRAATPSAAAELVIPEKEVLLDRIDVSRERLNVALRTMLENLKEKVESLADSYVLREPINVITQFSQEIDDLEKRLNVFAGHSLDMAGSRFMRSAEKLEMLNPLAVLRRGYSITFKDGCPVRDTGMLRVGDSILTRFGGGEAESRIEKISATGTDKKE